MREAAQDRQKGGPGRARLGQVDLGGTFGDSPKDRSLERDEGASARGRGSLGCSRPGGARQLNPPQY